MAYVGGKARSSDHIIDILNNPMFDNINYIEPFVGYCHILRRVVNKRSYTAYDNNDLVIELFKGVQQDKPYPRISKKKYHELKIKCQHERVKPSFECAIGAFTYSYNGKQWGGYAPKSKDGVHNYLKQRLTYYNSLKHNTTFMNTLFSTKDYRNIKLPNKPALIYCDPPYRDTTQYGTVFDSDEFWERMRKWSKHHYVIISEYKAPSDFICVSKKKKAITLNNKRDKTTYKYEKVFIYSKGLLSI